MNAPKKKYLVIGIGNLYRSDDAVGILVARNLKNRKPNQIVVKEQSGEGTSLMEAWKGFDGVLIVDAVSSGSPYGEIHRLDTSKPIPSKFFSCSTHNFGVAEAIELARTLNQLPKDLRLYGIEGKIFEPGEVISPEVLPVIELVVDEIIQHFASPY